MTFQSISPTSHILHISDNNSTHIITTLHDLNHFYNQQQPDFIKINELLSTHVSPENNFKLINQPNDKIFIIDNKIIIELKILDNIYIAFIHFSLSNDLKFISYALDSLNKLLVHELTNSHNERLIKLFDKKLVLFSTLNHSFSHFYKIGPFEQNSDTIFNFKLPNSSEPWFEYSLKLNQFIYNNLSKEIQLQKQQEKKTMAELAQQSHSHAKSKIKFSSHKRQKHSDMDM